MSVTYLVHYECGWKVGHLNFRLLTLAKPLVEHFEMVEEHKTAACTDS